MVRQHQVQIPRIRNPNDHTGVQMAILKDGVSLRICGQEAVDASCALTLGEPQSEDICGLCFALRVVSQRRRGLQYHRLNPVISYCRRFAKVSRVWVKAAQAAHRRDGMAGNFRMPSGRFRYCPGAKMRCITLHKTLVSITCKTSCLSLR